MGRGGVVRNVSGEGSCEAGWGENVMRRVGEEGR